MGHLPVLHLVAIMVVSVSGQIRFEDDVPVGRRRALESLPLEEDYYYDDQPLESMSMSTADRLRDCGRQDACPPEWDIEKLKQASGQFPGKDKVGHDFQANPFMCRCDRETCTRYGDCCWGVAANHSARDVNGRNPWRCLPLEPRQRTPTWAMMISACPERTLNPALSVLCSGEKWQIPEGNRNSLIDLPVYSNRSGALYKNIYCSQCHRENASDILQYTLRLVCNKEFSPEERHQFQQAAEYQQGERIWRSGNVSCYLSALELSTPQSQVMTIPSIRYCGFQALDSCPLSGNFSERTRLLCSSYSQYVTDREGTTYKNPHCFRCNTLQPLEKQERLNCKRYSPADTRGASFGPGDVGASFDGAGLSFLFDFGLGQEKNQYVGYQMLCTESEVWDYVRGTCAPMLCGKDHALKDGFCMPTNETAGKDGRTDLEGEESESLEHGPKCYRILLSRADYEVLGENRSIVVNQSSGDLIQLRETDYEKWNESHISICAKFLYSAFPSRFPALLSYLSVVSVGLSLTFLFLHILLFLILPKLRNLPARNLFCLTLSLFLSQSLLLIFIGHPEWGLACVAAAMTMHYFFLAAFYWMNIMSFDIWRTFTGGMLRRSQSPDSKSSTFLKYCIFGWGTPLLIVFMAGLTDFGLSTWIDSDLIERVRPFYGENGMCWISSRLSLFVFFAVPVALVICSNLVLFSLTARAILVQHREANRVLKGMEAKIRSPTKPSSTSTDEVRLKLYVKLALIMGMTWILGFASAFLLWNWLWYFFVVLNGLQGTFIFFAFDFKRKVWGMLVGVGNELRGRRPDPSRERRGTATSTTSGMIKSTNMVSFSVSDGNK